MARWFTILLEIATIAGGVIGFIKSPKLISKIIVAFLSIIFVIFVNQITQTTEAAQKPIITEQTKEADTTTTQITSTKIISPSNNREIYDYKVIEIVDKQGNRIFSRNIPVIISGRNVPSGNYISLMTSVGGKIWWANGDSIPTNRLGANPLTIDKATFGTKDGDTFYMLYLSITDNALESGKEYVKNRNYLEEVININLEEPKPKPKPIPILFESDTVEIQFKK